MSKDALPIRYHLEIYESSLVGDPVVAFESNSPFLSFHKGDYFDPGMWSDQLKHFQPGVLYQVLDVLHRVWQIDGSHVGHQLGVCIAPIGRL